MIYFKVKDNTPEGKAFAEFIKTLPFVDIIHISDVPNETTLHAIKDAEQGRVKKTKNVNDLIASLNK